MRLFFRLGHEYNVKFSTIRRVVSCKSTEKFLRAVFMRKRLLNNSKQFSETHPASVFNSKKPYYSMIFIFGTYQPKNRPNVEVETIYSTRLAYEKYTMWSPWWPQRTVKSSHFGPLLDRFDDNENQPNNFNFLDATWLKRNFAKKLMLLHFSFKNTKSSIKTSILRLIRLKFLQKIISFFTNFGKLSSQAH